jgi:cell division protease FtsH
MNAQDTESRAEPRHSRSASGWLRRRIGRRAAQPERQPWRVEGAAEEPRRDRPTGNRGVSRFWWLVIVLLAVNWIIASIMLGPESRAMDSYTFFLSQVSGTNVVSITSTGETIEGTFKQPVSYAPPQGGGAEQVTRFTTQRPTFANDDLFQQLRSTEVPVNANPPDAGAPLWQQLVFGFGPTLLLILLLVAFTRRAAGGAGGRRLVRSFPGDASQPGVGTTHLVRGRGRHR